MSFCQQVQLLSTMFGSSTVAMVTDYYITGIGAWQKCMPCSISFIMTLQTEFLSTEISDFLKKIIFLKSFNSLCYSVYQWYQHRRHRIFFGYIIRWSFFSFQNKPKDLDPSYKMDLDLWDCSGRVKLVL